MIRWIVIGVATAVLLGLGSYLIREYGIAKYEAGYASAGKKTSDTHVEEVLNNGVNLERISNETKLMDEDAVNASLLSLGILREHTDY